MLLRNEMMRKYCLFGIRKSIQLSFLIILYTSIVTFRIFFSTLTSPDILAHYLITSTDVTYQTGNSDAIRWHLLNITL
jgi:N-acetyl-anhydromuramyl-L-alanine amidase AmpD